MSQNLMSDIEDLVNDVVRNVKDKIDVVQKPLEEARSVSVPKKSSLGGGQEYVDQLKSSKWATSMEKAKGQFFSLLRVLGVNDVLLRETFMANKKEFFGSTFRRIYSRNCIGSRLEEQR